MAGLPHYRNDKAAMSLYEPVYMNLFTVTITPPSGLAGWDQLTINNILKVAGLEVEKVPGVVEQNFKGAKRRYAAAMPDSTVVDITIDWEVNLNDSNSMYVYKALRSWCDLIFDPLTGAQTLKKNYAGGPMTVSLANKAGDITRQWTFPTIWPTTPLNAMDLDYSTGATLYQLNTTFAADYWNDVSV